MIKKLKRSLKNINSIDRFYNKIYGNKKAARIRAERRQQLQRDGFSVVILIEDILSKCPVNYFIDYGSLLGIVRDGKFMDYDEDIDYSIFINKKFTWYDLEEALSKNGFSKLHQFVYKGEVTQQTYIYGSLTIDFFNHYDDAEHGIVYWYSRNKEMKYKTIDEYSVAKGIMLKVNRMNKITINNLTFTAPENIDAYLASIYTNRWKIPDPDWKSANGPAYHFLNGERAVKVSFD